MALPDFHHGVRVIEITGGVRPLRTIATAIFGVVCTAPDADAAKFPVDTPVLVTDVAAAIGAAGVEGTLSGVLQAIADHANAIGVIVRVEEGADAAGTAANVIGTVTAGGDRTGMQALLAAEAAVGVRPRVLAVPGLETQAVITALAVVAQKLRAMAYCGIPGCETVAASNLFRANFSQREVELIWPDFEAVEAGTGATIIRPSAAVAVGLRCKLDHELGWHKTLSNVAVSGVTGISKPVSWALQDPSTDAGVLNAAGVTTLIRSNGFRFWGNRTCADDPKFEFESATRTAQVLMDTIAEGLMWAADKPLTPSLARDILETINAKFRALKTQGYILGGSAWLDPALNTADVLAQGQLAIDYDYTPVPPLENLMLRQRITDRYLADFASLVSTG